MGRGRTKRTERLVPISPEQKGAIIDYLNRRDEEVLLFSIMRRERAVHKAAKRNQLELSIG